MGEDFSGVVGVHEGLDAAFVGHGKQESLRQGAGGGYFIQPRKVGTQTNSCDAIFPEGSVSITA